MSSAKHRFVDDDVVDTVADLMREFELDEGSAAKVDNEAGGGLNLEDELVIKELVKYKHGVSSDGVFPGPLIMENLQNVPYDAESEYAKRVKSKTETYFAKFSIKYNIDGKEYTTKHCSVQGAYLDLMARPEFYQGRPNGFSKEYVAVYFGSRVVDAYKRLIEQAGYKLDSAGINIDTTQSLVSFNANYATEEVPRLTIHRIKKITHEDGTTEDKRIMDVSNTIESMYVGARPNGGVIFRGFAFGEFGVSKRVPVGAPAPPLGSTLKLTFKLLGFHAFSRSQTVRAIKSRSAKSKYGV